MPQVVVRWNKIVHFYQSGVWWRKIYRSHVYKNIVVSNKTLSCWVQFYWCILWTVCVHLNCPRKFNIEKMYKTHSTVHAICPVRGLKGKFTQNFVIFQSWKKLTDSQTNEVLSAIISVSIFKTRGFLYLLTFECDLMQPSNTLNAPH